LRLTFCVGDYLLAQKLLAESVHTLPMCEANPEIDIGTNRMVMLFTGIAPYRGVVCFPFSSVSHISTHQMDF
jgi:hypothetical protein